MSVIREFDIFSYICSMGTYQLDDKDIVKFFKGWYRTKDEQPPTNQPNKKRKIDYPPNTTSKYKQYYKRDLDRNMIMTLQPLDFEALISMPCTYCGKSNCGGIDRIDSSVGYIPSNCQPCCTKCNMMKHTMTHSTFIDHVKRIATNIDNK